jgi:hypothetical protein
VLDEQVGDLDEGIPTSPCPITVSSTLLAPARAELSFGAIPRPSSPRCAPSPKLDPLQRSVYGEDPKRIRIALRRVLGGEEAPVLGVIGDAAYRREAA